MVNLTDTFTKLYGRPPTQTELGTLMKMKAEQEQRKKQKKLALPDPPKPKPATPKKAPKPKPVDQLSTLKSKVAKQRNEIARLTKLVEQLEADKAKLLSDLKWIRGEKP